MNLLDTPVREAAWAALDFESTGAEPGGTDEPVQVGMAVWRGGRITDFFRSYVQAPARITRAARAVHGIAGTDLREAPALADLWPEFKARLGGAVVVAHGAGTEKRFLRAFPLHGFGPWADTLTLARALLPHLAGHSLAEVVGALGAEAEVRALCPSLGWHDALFDAVACLVVLRVLIERGGWPVATVGQVLSPDTSAYRRRRALRHEMRSAGWDE